MVKMLEGQFPTHSFEDKEEEGGQHRILVDKLDTGIIYTITDKNVTSVLIEETKKLLFDAVAEQVQIFLEGIEDEV